MSMNIFRLAGDMSHVFSIIILLLRLKVAKNANGACAWTTTKLHAGVLVYRWPASGRGRLPDAHGRTAYFFACPQAPTGCVHP